MVLHKRRQERILSLFYFFMITVPLDLKEQPYIYRVGFFSSFIFFFFPNRIIEKKTMFGEIHFSYFHVRLCLDQYIESM